MAKRDKKRKNYEAFIGYGIIIVPLLLIIISFYNNPSNNNRFITISFENEHGSNIESIQHIKKTPLYVDDLDDLDNYTFEGWYANGTKFINGTKIKRNLTLNAVWRYKYQDSFFVYALNNSKTEFSITKKLESGAESFPEEFMGLPVTTLYSSAIDFWAQELNFSDNLETLIVNDFNFIFSQIQIVRIGKGYKNVDLSPLIDISDDLFGAELNNLLYEEEETIAGAIFNYLPFLESIIVSEENTLFQSVDDVLFLKEYMNLVCYPTNKQNEIYEIPEGIEYFYTSSYQNKYLTTLIVPESFISFGSNNLSMFRNLEDIQIHPDNNYYAYVNGVLYSKDMKKLSYYPINKKDRVFTIPDGVETLENKAFSSNGHLSQLFIPSSIINLNNQYFYNLNNLRSITVNENNLYYASLDGVLFSKDLSILYYFPSKIFISSYIIPRSVITIKSYAFYNCYLNDVYIPDTVTRIENSAFSQMDISLYCEAYSKPSLWNKNWYNKSKELFSSYNVKVFWGWGYPY